MTEPRIRWEPTKHGGWTGHAGTSGPILFALHRPVLAGQVWTLTSTLPGWLDEVEGGTVGKLKVEAEHWLEEFVSSLGAIFPKDDPGSVFGRLDDEEEFRAALFDGKPVDDYAVHLVRLTRIRDEGGDRA